MTWKGESRTVSSFVGSAGLLAGAVWAASRPPRRDVIAIRIAPRQKQEATRVVMVTGFRVCWRLRRGTEGGVNFTLTRVGVVSFPLSCKRCKRDAQPVS